MTPPATAAARALPSTRTPARRGGRPSAPGSAPSRRPRRISGPAGGVAAVAAPALLPSYAPAPSPARPSRPTRPSRPARPRTAPPRPGRPRTAPRRQPTRRAAPRVHRLPSVGGLTSILTLRERLSWRRLPMALAPGRLWIGVIAFALIGIVTMQLALLRINTSIGADLERAAALQRENVALSIGISEADSGEAIERNGRADGMIAVAPGDLRFVAAGGRSAVAGAVKALRSYSVEGSAGIPGAAVGTGYLTSATGETAVQPTATGGEYMGGAEAVEGEGETAPLEAEAAPGEGEATQAGGEPGAGEYEAPEATGYGASAESEGGATSTTTGGEGSQSVAGGEGSQSTTGGESVPLGAGGGVQAGG